MDDANRKAIYEAQCENVRALLAARKQIKTNINEALRSSKDHQAKALTKTLAVVFTAWVEASFSKLLHTPDGFDLDEIATIKAASSKNVVRGWEKCIEIAIQDHDADMSGFDQSDRDRLQVAVQDLIKDPSELRNKIAHGQWVRALNGKNTDVNEVATAAISELSVVKIDMWFDCQSKLSVIVEHLIVSPNKAFIKTYRNLMYQLETMYSQRSKWTLETKKSRLKQKKSSI
ncbi:hypothetical protein MRBLRC7O_002806 [Agrobacterium radiobacter]|uniref:hypothetical protein n=1 Tax=Agrobacterium radiobacter TaxID=362 RepID=UPI003466DDEE